MEWAINKAKLERVMKWAKTQEIEGRRIAEEQLIERYRLLGGKVDETKIKTIHVKSSVKKTDSVGITKQDADA